MLKFHTLEVARVIPDTAQSVRLLLKVPGALVEDYRFSPGQHLNLEVVVGGETLRRSYSLCNQVGAVDPRGLELELAVKRQPGGRVSNYINDQLGAGDNIKVMTPGGHFNVPLESSGRRSFVAFAAGSGITPVLSIIRSTLALEPASSFTLFYGNRDSASVMLRDQLHELKDRHPTRFRIFHILSREQGEVDLYNGRLDKTKVAELCGAFCQPDAVSHWFVCGPASMIENVSSSLQELGVASERVHSERFTVGGQAAVPPRRAQADTVRSRCQVLVIMDGKERQFQVAAQQSVLEAGLASGLELPYSCAGGVCSTCRAKLVKGTVDMPINYALEPWELEAGYVLACQCYPTSGELILDYDQT
jgi:ring-1,2-phenylacetyl-CoA epoxidase subunit PaaE